VLKFKRDWGSSSRKAQRKALCEEKGPMHFATVEDGTERESSVSKKEEGSPLRTKRKHAVGKPKKRAQTLYLIEEKRRGKE